MNEFVRHTPGGDIVQADGEDLNLRNRKLAAVLAWLIPGAGHYYQRRYFKSAIFFICILSTYFLGFFIGGQRCVYASWNGGEKRWQFLLQAGVGIPAMPAALQAWRGPDAKPLWGGFMAAPRNALDLDLWHFDTASGFDMGTLYTMIAGLLNYMVIFDAYAGPLPPPAPKKREKKRDGPDQSSAETA